MKHAFIGFSILGIGLALSWLAVFKQSADTAISGSTEGATLMSELMEADEADNEAESVAVISNRVESSRAPDQDAAHLGTETGAPVHRAVIRSWSGSLEPSLGTIIARFEADESDRFTIPTFDGGSVTVKIKRTRTTLPGAQTLTGVIEGEPGSLVSLARMEQAEAGGIFIPSRNKTYEIRPTPDGGIRFNEIDVHALGECQICLTAREAEAGPAEFHPTVKPVPLLLNEEPG